MQKKSVRLADRQFDYFVGWDCAAEAGTKIGGLKGDKVFLIKDAGVPDDYIQQLLAAIRKSTSAHVLGLSTMREAVKTMEELTRLGEEAQDLGISRRSVIVALGGGVAGNIAGLLAALLFRGIRFVHMPTTLVAAFDSVLSFKQAVNLGKMKNALGTYYQPEMVLCDFSSFATLPEREVVSGLCESVKNVLAIVPHHFEALDEILNDRKMDFANCLRLLDMSIEAKAAVMEGDYSERRRGLVLEYGHTFGHAIELLHAETKQSDPISHGEAVAIGMHLAAEVARAKGDLNPADYDHHKTILSHVGVERRLPCGVRPDDLVRRLAHDNKRGLIPTGASEIPLVLLEGLGRPVFTGELPITSAPMAIIERAIEDMAAA